MARMASQGAVEKVPNSPTIDLAARRNSESTSESDTDSHTADSGLDGSEFGAGPALLLGFDETVEDEIGRPGRLVCT